MIQKGKYLSRTELIGRYIEIVESSNHCLVGIKGIIRDETKNTFIIETNKGMKKIIKNQCTFAFNTSNGIIKIDGKKLERRPEDRIKNKK